MLPLKHAREAGYDQLVWLDGKEMKYIEESGTMNLFFQIGKTLVTPLADGTILEGITRDSILGLAVEAGLPVEVRKVSLEEVVAAYDRGDLKDAFGTGTALRSKIGAWYFLPWRTAPIRPCWAACWTISKPAKPRIPGVGS
jgi:branched-chain amino acid aminotransferase